MKYKIIVEVDCSEAQLAWIANRAWWNSNGETTQAAVTVEGGNVRPAFLNDINFEQVHWRAA